MVTAYAYTTIAAFEKFCLKDFSNVDALYVDASVEEVISAAERVINGYCHQSFTGTIPDGVVAATHLIAKRMMDNQMIIDGHMRDKPYIPYTTLPDSDMKALLGSNIKAGRYHWMVSA
jgi:hypothetical protein